MRFYEWKTFYFKRNSPEEKPIMRVVISGRLLNYFSLIIPNHRSVTTGHTRASGRSNASSAIRCLALRRIFRCTVESTPRSGRTSARCAAGHLSTAASCTDTCVSTLGNGRTSATSAIRLLSSPDSWSSTCGHIQVSTTKREKLSHSQTSSLTAICPFFQFLFPKINRRETVQMPS